MYSTDLTSELMVHVMTTLTFSFSLKLIDSQKPVSVFAACSSGYVLIHKFVTNVYVSTKISLWF